VQELVLESESVLELVLKSESESVLESELESELAPVPVLEQPRKV
jgi:hypothetical protein